MTENGAPNSQDNVLVLKERMEREVNKGRGGMRDLYG